MQAGTFTFEEIFTENKIFNIPFFQRSYVWNEEQWERCIEDTINSYENNHPHFMGALIFKQFPVTSTGEELFAVIDGQQRLTTLLILLKVLADKSNTTVEFYKKFRSTSGKPVFKHNHADDSVFSKIFYHSSIGIDESDKKSKIFACYQFFYDKIEQYGIINPADIMRLFYFVQIKLEANDDEQEIFETINSIGVELTAGELLKNELFNYEEFDYYKSTWGKTFENILIRDYWELSIAYGKQCKITMLDLYLRSYYYMITTLGRGYNPIGSLFKKYQDFLKKEIAPDQRHDFIENMMSAADIFRRTFNHVEILETPKSVLKPIQRLVFIIFTLQCTAIIPYIMLVLKQSEQEEKNKIFTLLETYLIRRFICNLISARYNLQFIQFIKDRVLTYDDLLRKISSGIDDTSRMPTEKEVFNQICSGDRNVTKNRLAVTIFYLIELHERSENPALAKLLAFTNYSCQELLPSKIENWYDKSTLSETEIKSIELASKRIGNSVMSSKKVANNKKWNDKRQQLQGGCNNISTAYNCLEETVWDVEKINQRTCMLAEKINKVWQYQLDDKGDEQYRYTAAQKQGLINFLESAESNKMFYEINQIKLQSEDLEIKALANEYLLRAMEKSVKDTADTDSQLPHFLSEDFSGKKPYKWTWNNQEYHCTHWSDLFKTLAKLLYQKDSETMHNFCAYGGDNYICSYARTRMMTKKWDIIGLDCYIYTAINAMSMQKSILNMLKAMKVDIREISIYYK